MPSSKKKKPASAAKPNLRSHVDPSPTRGDKSRDSVTPPLQRDSSNKDGGDDVSPPLNQRVNPLSSLQRDASGDSESDEEGINFGSPGYEIAAEECLAAIEVTHPEIPLTDAMRRKFKSMYPTLLAKGYDDDAAVLYMYKEIADGHDYIPLLEGLPKLFPPPKSYDVSTQNNGRLQNVITVFGQAIAGIDKGKVKADLSPNVVEGKIVQGFGKTFHSGMEHALEPVFQAGILNKANLPRMEQFQELTASGAAVAILGRSILPESHYAFERAPTRDDDDDIDEVDFGASLEELVASARNKASTNVKSRVKRATGHFRPNLFFTTPDKITTKYLKNFTQFVHNYKERMPIPFEFRYSLAILNEFSKFVLAYFRVVIAAFPSLYVGIDEYLNVAEGELLNVVRHPKSHGSFLEYRAIMEFNYSYIYLLPTLVDFIVNSTSNEVNSVVLAGFGDQIGDIFKYKLRTNISIHGQVVKFHQMVYDARQFCRMRDGEENAALADKLMLAISESQFNGLTNSFKNPNNRLALQEILRMFLDNKFDTLLDVAQKVQQLTQDGSLSPEVAAAKPFALVASGVPVEQHQSSKLKPCFEFQKTGACSRGNSCRFHHNAPVATSAPVVSQLPVTTDNSTNKIKDYTEHFDSTLLFYRMYKYLHQSGALAPQVKIGNIFRRVQIIVNGTVMEGVTLQRNNTRFRGDQ